MEGDTADGGAAAGAAVSQTWISKEGTPLRSLPGIRGEPASDADSAGAGAHPSFYVCQPQPLSPWLQPPTDDPESAATSDLSDLDSISSSTGELFRTVVVPVPSQGIRNKSSLTPTPSFTYIDAKAAATARKRTVTCCASKSVLKITVTFCVSFLLGMALTVIYMEVFLWRRR